MHRIILLLSLVCWQRNVAMTTDGKTKLILSKIENEQETLSIEMDILKAESTEMRNMIANLNNTYYNEICKQKNVTNINCEDFNIDISEKAGAYKRKLDNILKAFVDEKNFYRKTVAESKILQEEFRTELENQIDSLSTHHQEINRNASVKIIDLQRKFEQYEAHGLKTALESQITAAKLNSEIEIMQLKEQYKNLENKFKLFQENVTANFVIEEKLSDLIKMLIPQDDSSIQKLVSQCHGSWVFHSDPNICLLFVTKGKTWNDAQQFCRYHGGRLIQIENSQKYDQVKLMYEESGLYWGYDWESCWAGGSDKSSEGTWRWSTTGERFTWSNWDRYYSEPNGGSDENCLAVLLSYNYFRWNDEYCTYKLPFICEKVLS